jgi:hypothetical protein
MMYSCALWDDAEGGVRGDLVSGPTAGDLEAAQARKINHVLKKARVKPGDRILEFGSGWGGMSIAVRTPLSYIVRQGANHLIDFAMNRPPGWAVKSIH